jgi:hypothetical protein
MKQGGALTLAAHAEEVKEEWRPLCIWLKNGKGPAVSRA